jgi:hypothetical protein
VYPPPRRRAWLVIGIVAGCLVAVGGLVFGLAIGVSKSGDDDPSRSSGGPSNLPAACDVLSGEQVADLLGEAREPLSDRPPEEKDGQTVTDCRWSSGRTIMGIEIHAQSSVAKAEDEYQHQHITCDTSVTVPGADEACLVTTTSDAAGGARVIARAGQVLVDFTYTTSEPLSDGTVDTAVETTSTVIDKLP